MKKEPTSDFATREFPYFARIEAMVTQPRASRQWNNNEIYPAEENYVVRTAELQENKEEFDALVDWLRLAIERALVLHSVSEGVDADHEWTLYVRPCSATKSFFEIFPHYFINPYENLASLDGPPGQQEIERKAKDLAWELLYRTEDLIEAPTAAPAAFVLTAVEDYDLFIQATKNHGMSFLRTYCSLRYSEVQRAN